MAALLLSNRALPNKCDADSSKSVIVMIQASTESGTTNYGAGIVVAQSESRTIVVTANHVIRNRETDDLLKSIEVEFLPSRGKTFLATANYRYTLPDIDLAVLFIEHKPTTGVPSVLPSPHTQLVSPSSPPALVSEKVCLIGFPDRRPWVVSVANEVMHSDTIHLWIRSTTVMTGNSGGAVIDTFGRLVGMVTKIPAGGGIAEAIPMEVVTYELTRWGIPLGIVLAKSPTSSAELAELIEQATRVEVQYPVVNRPGTEPRLLDHRISIAVPPKVKELKPKITVRLSAYNQYDDPLVLAFAPPNYEPVESYTPPVKLDARIWFEFSDGRKIGPIVRSLDFQSGPFSEVRKNPSRMFAELEEAKLKNIVQGWFDLEAYRANLEKKESTQSYAEDPSRPSRIAHEVSVLRQGYPRWRVHCDLIPEPELEEWVCDVDNFVISLGLLARDQGLEEVVLGGEPDSQNLSVPLDGDKMRELFADRAAQVLRNGSKSVYVRVQLRSGDTFAPKPKRLCERQVMKTRNRTVCQ